tara:strand:- start:287 stop:403 length:117 start_codon:yes stop_codon:yes gene_type:complete
MFKKIIRIIFYNKESNYLDSQLWIQKILLEKKYIKKNI